GAPGRQDDDDLRLACTVRSPRSRYVTGGRCGSQIRVCLDVLYLAQRTAEGDGWRVRHPDVQFLAPVQRYLLGPLALDDAPVLFCHPVGKVVEVRVGLVERVVPD